jgi:two-component system CheB/CheR fusion protein
MEHREALDRAKAPKLIVGVGASAGGLRALETLFRKMPADSGCAFVVVQHLSPDFRSLMDELLGRQTNIRIHRAEHGMRLEADAIYLNPPKKLLRLASGAIELSDLPSDRQLELPINAFFESLGAGAGPAGVAVVLSGTGTDGSDGVRAVKGAGGLVIVQEPTTAEFDGMPTSAMNTGCADYVLPAEEIPGAIQRYCQNPAARPAHPEDDLPESGGEMLPEEELAKVLRLLKHRYGLDFSQYKLATVQRRIQRRKALAGRSDGGEFMRALESSPTELDQLYCDLLIGVTEFFRDPAAFEALRTAVYEPLLRRESQGDVRVWIAGCATGEEAYTHAILLDQVAASCGYGGKFTIFATDAHRNSLEIASAGCYPPERVATLPAALRERYFQVDKSGMHRVSPELRQRVVFAPHNLLSDPPFTKMDVVSCRNLLIYLGPAAHERVISLLHYALRREGVMMLGLSEGLGRLTPDFESLDAKHRLFRKIRDLSIVPDFRTSGASRSGGARTALTNPLSVAPTLPRGLLNAYDQLLGRHLPAGFIVSPEGEVLHFIGDGAKYLDPQVGRASDNLLTRTSGELRLALSTLIPRAAQRRSFEHIRGVRVATSAAGEETVEIHVTPLADEKTGTNLVHVSLTPSHRPVAPEAAATEGTVFAATAEQNERIEFLEQELIATKENLQATVEELQSTNEELQAANEEMLAANEELQSTNEELHSVNEELYTVNAEFERKNHELNQTVADLDNLLGATDAGTLFLDRDLRIRRFNPAIQATFHLLPQDIGRSIEHIAYHLSNQTQMIEEAKRVVQTGEVHETEERTRDGRWLLRRILPFYGSSRAIEGVVLTFTRIDAIKEMQTKLDLAMGSARLVWWEWDMPSDRLVTHAPGWCILGYEVECLLPTSETWIKLTHPDDVEEVRRTLNAALAGKTPEWECEHRLLAFDKKWRWVLNKGRITKSTPDGKPLQMIGTTQDINDRKIGSLHLFQLSKAIEQMDSVVLVTDRTGAIESVNSAFERATGYKREEVIGRNPRFLKSGYHPPEFYAQMWATLSHGDAWRGELVNKRKDGTLFRERASITPLRDHLGRITNFVAVKEDISALKGAEEERRRLEAQLLQSQKMETLGTLAGGIAHDFNNLLTGIIGHLELTRVQLGSHSAAQAHLEAISGAARRAADLVQRILAFSRHKAPTQERTVVAHVLRELMPILRSSIASNVELKLDDQSEGAAVMIDPVQLEQVVMNLCSNAAQAVGDKVGRVEMRVAVTQLEKDRTFDVGRLAAGRYVELAVADNGVGIPESDVQRIFDPFFTTKGPGQGTGLGLAIVHSVVSAHEGALRVQSSPGRGTTFTLYFPLLAVAEPTNLDSTPAAPAAPGPHAVLHGLRICVVDDEELVVDLTRMTLESFGAKVTAFGDPVQCLAAIVGAPSEIDLLVTDQVMPGLAGSDLIRKLRSLGIRIPVLLISGYSRGTSPAQMTELAPCRFLGKPFEAKALRDAVLQLQAGT